MQTFFIPKPAELLTSTSYDGIRKMLASFPTALPLVDLIESFYGSHPKLCLQDQSIPYSVANIDSVGEIELRIHPIPPQIVHELLHLKLFSQGFPFVSFCGANDSCPISVARILTNQLHHPIFIDEFLSHGFSTNEFFYDSDSEDNLADYQAEIKKIKNHPDRAKYARGVWNYYYLDKLIADRMGYSNKRIEFLIAGKSLFPETMEADADYLSQWFHRGSFRNYAQFHVAMNKMLEQVGLGPVRWVKLNSQFALIDLV